MACHGMMEIRISVMAWHGMMEIRALARWKPRPCDLSTWLISGAKTTPTALRADVSVGHVIAGLANPGRVSARVDSGATMRATRTIMSGSDDAGFIGSFFMGIAAHFLESSNPLHWNYTTLLFTTTQINRMDEPR